MSEYEVTLEGQEGEKGYFILFTVACEEKDLESLCIDKASELNLQIISVDEVSLIRSLEDQTKSGVIDVSGKSYFDLS